MKELKQHRLLKSNKDSAFQKTEKLLYNYKQFKQVIEKKQEQIKTIENEGWAKRSKSIVILSTSNSYETSTDGEKAEARIEEIQASIEKIESYIQFIDNSLDRISTDQYFDIIRLKYFEGLTNEDISFELDCDPSTVTRHKNRLINIIKIYLFPDDSIVELFY